MCVAGAHGDASCSPADQNKIRVAVSLRRVDSADVPATAKDPALSAPGPSQKKRKLQYEASLNSSQNSPPSSSQPSSSQPSSSQPLRRISGPSLSQIAQLVEEPEEDVPDEESRDELYVMLNTAIVGVQYYKGMNCHLQWVRFVMADEWVLGLVGAGEEVTLVRQPQNQYDRYVAHNTVWMYGVWPEPCA